MDVNSLRREVDELHQLIGNATFYELLGVPRTADEPAIKAAFRNRARLLHADNWGHLQLPEDLRRRMERVLGELSRAQGTLTNAKAREEYDAGLALAERGVPTDVRLIFAADEAYRSGRRLLERGAFAEAQVQFGEAARANSSEPDYWAHLYWTEFCVASKNQQPERSTVERLRRHLRELTVKHPMCSSAWLYLGHIERNDENVAEATVCYRKVLELDPNNFEASSAMRLLNRREEKKAGGFFSRLFRKG